MQSPEYNNLYDRNVYIYKKILPSLKYNLKINTIKM